MKKIILILVIPLIISCSNNYCKNNNNDNIIKWQSIFKGDSGYVDSANSIMLLEVLDTSLKRNINPEKLNKLKTKYYYDKLKQKIIGCIDGYGNDLCYFFELLIKNNSIIEMKYILFNHDNVSCCTGKFDDFIFNGKFYTFKGCVSGSGYCATYLYCFNNLVEKDEMSNILIEETSNNITGNYTLRSDIDFRSDTILFHYTRTIYFGDDRGDSHKNKRVKFSVKALFDNNNLNLINAKSDSINLMGWK